MIRIITLDRHGQPAVFENVETLTLPNDIIIMNPGVPAVQTAEFSAYVRALCARHNKPVVMSLSKPDTAARPVEFLRPDLFARRGSA